MMDHDWQSWLDRLKTGRLTPAETREFEAALKEHPERMDEYLDALLTEAALECDSLPALPATRRGFPRRRILAAAAAVALVASTAFFLGQRLGPSRSIVATVTDADAAAEAAGIRIGAMLKKGALTVPDGSKIGVAMHSGARLEIQGPAEMRLESPDKITMDRGRVSTYAPPYARGFIIDTADGRLVDLGTRFVTAAGTARGTEAHVIEGQVEAHVAAAGAPRDLRGGSAVAFKDGKVETIEYLKRRLDVPLDPDPVDSDGDGIPDVVEEYFGTDPRNPRLLPRLLRVEESFQGYSPGPVARIPALGLGMGDNMVWEGGGDFLGQGLRYGNNGRVLRSSGGCIGTVGEGSVGAALFPLDGFPAKGTIYLSFLMQLPPGGLEEENAFAGLLLYKDGREEFFAGDPASMASFGSRFRTAPLEQSFELPIDDETHLFVIRIDRTHLVTDVFIDPPLGEPESAASRRIRYHDVPEFDRISVRSGRRSAPYPAKFDEFRLGLTWESVLPLDPE